MAEIQHVGGIWTTGKNMPTLREYFGCAAVGSKIYCIGGDTNSENSLNTLEIYNTLTDTWTVGKNMPTARCYFGCVAVGHRIYCIDGVASRNSSSTLRIVEIYDTLTNTWTTGSPIPISQMTELLYVAIGTRIYAIMPGKKICIYDTETNTWSTGATITINYHAACVAVENKIYFFGGISESREHKIYDTETGILSEGALMPTGRSALSGAAIEGKIYCVGGVTNGNRITDAFEIYDTVNGAWLIGPNMPIGRSYLRCAVANGKLYCIAGNMGGGYLTSVAIYTSGILITEQYATSDGTEVQPHTFASVEPDDDYVKTAPTIPGYTYVGYKLNDGDLQTGDTVTINNVQSDHTVTFVYERENPPTNALITHKYQTPEGLDVLAATFHSVEFGDTHTAVAQDIANYRYIGYTIDGGALQAGETVTIEDVQKDYTITFVYEPVDEPNPPKQFTITQEYRTDDGMSVRITDYITVAAGSAYTQTAPGITGYTRIGHRIDGGPLQAGRTATITNVQGDHTVTFIYAVGDENSNGNVDVKGCCCCNGKNPCCCSGKRFAMNIEVCGYEEPSEITAAINAAFEAK